MENPLENTVKRIEKANQKLLAAVIVLAIAIVIILII